MTTAAHADFDALSAYIDGEAPEWADHVEGCPRCRATAADLRALSATVGGPVEQPPAAQREAAIAAALGAVDVNAGAGAGAAQPAVAATRHELERDRFARRRWSPGPWAMPAVAAVVVALLGLSGVILSANRSTDENATTFAGPALDAKAESAVAGSPGAPVGDLGDVADPATLRARALGVTPAASSAGSARSAADSGVPAPAAAQSSATNTGNSGASVSSGASGAGGGSVATGAAGGGTGGSATLVAPNAVGTRPCEERARGREPGLGPVTYFATARRGTVPAYVLGFGSGPNITLLMLAQDGCGELLRSVGP